MSEPVLVAVDWGTTSFRACLMARDGSITARASAEAGIMQIECGAFEATLDTQLDALGAPVDLPVVASGMITSKQGWVEVPYVTCPAGAAEIGAGIVSQRTASGRRVSFVPGLVFEDKGGTPDVMRGEETQILGTISENETGSELAVLPGTHSKWALVEAGTISSFSTFMTGEVFAVLRQHSILGRLMTDPPDDPSGFEPGVRAALKNDEGLLRALFSVRTLPLTGRLDETATASYLSGLLIGSEISGARAAFGIPKTGVTLIGSSTLVDRYAEGLKIASIEHRLAPSDAAARGLFKLARQRGDIS